MLLDELYQAEQENTVKVICTSPIAFRLLNLASKEQIDKLISYLLTNYPNYKLKIIKNQDIITIAVDDCSHLDELLIRVDSLKTIIYPK